MYWLFGNVGNTMIGDWTFEQGVMTFNFTSETKSWYVDWPTSIGALTTGLGTNVLLPGEHFLHNLTTVPPPTAVCGAVPL
jgi:hypothetical protein